MKKIAVVIAITLALCFAHAADAQNLTLTSKMFSRYLGQNGGIFYDTPVVQTDLWAGWSNGVYADIWWSCAANGGGFHTTFANEIDYNVGIVKPLGAYNVDVGILYIDVVPLGTVFNDVWSPYAEIGRSFTLGTVAVAPYLRLEGYHNVDGSKTNFQPGWTQWGYAGARWRWSITPAIELSANARIFHDSGGFGKNKGWLGQAFVTTKAKMSARTAILTDIKFSTPIDVTDDRTTEFIVGAGLSYSF